MLCSVGGHRLQNYFMNLWQKKHVITTLPLSIPSCKKKYRYPIKHPEIIRGVAKCSKFDVHKIFGLIKCKILPPKHMLFPVIPVRTSKLTFPLCSTCAEEQCKNCMHDDEQWVLYGTWTSVEVHKALEHGYKMLTIYEIYHYSNSKKIFDLYVDTFHEIKTGE